MAKAPSAVLKKWQTNTRGAKQSYIDGIRAVTESPTEAAVRAIPKYLEGVRQAAESGRMEEGLRAVSLASWKDSAEKIGAERLASGVAKGEAKMGAFLAEFLPRQAQITAEVRAMPSTTLDERLQRMIAQATKTAELKFRRRS